MRILVTGASGNLGTALLRHLAAEYPRWEISGVCRRPPERGNAVYDRITWHALDLTDPAAAGKLAGLFADTDAVVHLAWTIQPTHDETALERVNVEGTRAVLAAVRESGVAHLVHASSVGAYAGAPDKPYVNEYWPIAAIPTSSYSRHKVQVEHDLDVLELERPELVISRLRPGLVLQGDAGSAITRYFVGPAGSALPVLRRLPLPVLPLPRGLLVPVVHADDVATGIARILDRRVPGAINLAADDPVSGSMVAKVLHTRPWEVSPSFIRRGVGVSWRSHVQPTDPGWFDLAMSVPLLDTDRARRDLDWRPERTAVSALSELLHGMAAGRGTMSPVLAPRSSRLPRLPRMRRQANHRDNSDLPGA